MGKSEADLIKELGERELAKRQRKEKRDAEFFELAMGCLKHFNELLPTLKLGDGCNVNWGPRKVSINKKRERRMPSDWTAERYPIEYSLSFVPSKEYSTFKERPQVGIYDFWPFLSTCEAKVFNRALKASKLTLPEQTAITVVYMDVRGCDGPYIWGPGMTDEQKKYARANSGNICL